MEKHMDNINILIKSFYKKTQKPMLINQIIVLIYELSVAILEVIEKYNIFITNELEELLIVC